MAVPVGGTIFVRANGKTLKAKGSWTYNQGLPKREMIPGMDVASHGYKETPQVPFIEGEVTLDQANFGLDELNGIVNGTVTVELVTGDVFTLSEAVQTGELTVNTEEGNVGVRFEGTVADFV